MTENKSILSLYLFNFFRNLQFFGAVAVPFYLHRVGLDYSRMFILEAIFSVAIIVFEVPTGVVADRFGRKLSLFCGSIFTGICLLLFGIYTSYPVLVIAQIVGAFGATLLSGADQALLYQVLKQDGKESQAATIMARYSAFGSAGLFLGFPAGSLLAGSTVVPYITALGLVFVLTAVTAGLAGLVILLVKEEAFVKSRISVIRQGVDGFLFIFKKPALRSFGLNYALISATTFFMFWFYQSLLLENKFPVAGMGFIGAGYNATAMLLLFFTPVVLRRLGTKNALFLSSLVPGILYVGLAFIPGLVMALVCIFGITSLKLFRAPLLSALMNEQIADSSRATVLSGVSMVQRIVVALLYPLVGWLTDQSLHMTFLALGTMTVLLSVLLRVEENKLR